VSRDLLRRALDALGQVRLAEIDDWLLFDDIRAELEKPIIKPCAYKVFRSDTNQWALRREPVNGLVCIPLYEGSHEP
jgi:hypothetical protein